MNRQQKCDFLWPLVDRLHLGYCWVRTAKGYRRIEDAFTPVQLSEHVVGTNTYGLTPIAPGTDTTRVAVLDFDSHDGATDWQTMRNTADTVCMVLEEDGYRPVMFRSSGGKGVHVFLVWDTPQDARSVREMLKAALAQCGLGVGTGGVAKQEVEVFPKNDRVAADGFGSMFALPLGGATKSEFLR